MTKVCGSCGREKDAVEFPKWRSLCIPCYKTQRIERYTQNSDRLRAAARIRARAYAGNPKYLARRRAIVRRYRSKPEVRAKDLAYTLNRHAQRQELLNKLKDVPCKDCGNSFPSYCMDFDHVRGDKFMDLSDMKGRTLELIMTEAAKCDVVCANCHRIRTHDRKSIKVA